MAQANLDLIEALRLLARRIETDTDTAAFRPDAETSRNLLDLGLSATELQQLHTLSDPEVLAHLAVEAPTAPQYLRALANLLEDQLLAMLDLPVDIRHMQLAA